jgi:hypothetical protein
MVSFFSMVAPLQPYLALAPLKAVSLPLVATASALDFPLFESVYVSSFSNFSTAY